MVCSSGDCSLAQHLAHPKCFEKLEQAAVMALKNIKGRAREWSDKERHRVSEIDFYIANADFLFLVPLARSGLRANLRHVQMSLWSRISPEGS